MSVVLISPNICNNLIQKCLVSLIFNIMVVMINLVLSSIVLLLVLHQLMLEFFVSAILTGFAQTCIWICLCAMCMLSLWIVNIKLLSVIMLSALLQLNSETDVWSMKVDLKVDLQKNKMW